MGIIKGLIALLDAVDDDRTRPGQAAAAAAPPAAAAPAPLEQIVAAHGVKIAELEASVAAMKGFVQSEVDRGVRATEATRRAVQRVRDRLERGDELADPGEDVPDVDAQASFGGAVQPVHGSMETAPLTPEQIRAAARSAVAFS